jgi:fucose permease
LSDNVRRATCSVYVVFVLSGVTIASLLSRVPQIRDALHLGPARLGLLLLSTAVGSLISLPLSGALGGAAMNALHVKPVVHLSVIAVCMAVIGQVGARGFLVVETKHTEPGAQRSPWQAWTERRTLLIGLFVLCSAFAEGTGNDWLGVAAIDGYGVSAATGSFVYVAFVAAMTIGRWFGPRVLDRHGRVPVMRAGALCSMVGVLIVVFGLNLGPALFGILMWGLGTALGFPTGMSAAADEPALAANRVSAVATIGYAAFLAGPSLIGVIGDHTGVRRALTLTAVVLALGSLVAGSTRPLPADSTIEHLNV